MPSPNNPKSSAQLIREHSKARYITVTSGRRGHNTLAKGSVSDSWMSGRARELMVAKYR
jgi:hypothetical protein